MSNFNWDTKSFWNKAKSGITGNVGIGVVSISKQITPPHNPQKDAYRNCSNCKKHYNYHSGKDKKCPPKKK